MSVYLGLLAINYSLLSLAIREEEKEEREDPQQPCKSLAIEALTSTLANVSVNNEWATKQFHKVQRLQGQKRHKDRVSFELHVSGATDLIVIHSLRLRSLHSISHRSQK